MTTLLIAMPTQGQVCTETMVTLIDLTQNISARGIRFSIKTFEGSDIVMSRNFLMSWFLAQETYSHILFLDADMSFASDVVFRLLDFAEPFTAAPYPQRKLNLDRFRQAVGQPAPGLPGDKVDTKDLLASALTYNVQKAQHQGEAWHEKRRSGFRTVPGVGTGLMLLAREVPETMVETGVARKLPGHNGLPLYAGARFHDFFSHLTNSAGDVMFGEDQSFCHRWVDGCGGDIWIDESAVVSHHGRFTFRGDFAKSDFPQS